MPNPTTETDVILAHTARWFSESKWSIEAFANELLIPRLEQDGIISTVEAESADEYQRARRTFGTRIGRIFRRTQPFPLSFKWAWIRAMPVAYQRDVERDLVALAGLLHVRAPRVVMAEEMSRVRANMGEVHREIGEFIASATPSHNGYYDHNDDPAAVDNMLREGFDALEALYTELCRAAIGTGRMPPRLRLRVPAIAGTGE